MDEPTVVPLVPPAGLLVAVAVVASEAARTNTATPMPSGPLPSIPRTRSPLVPTRRAVVRQVGPVGHTDQLVAAILAALVAIRVVVVPATVDALGAVPLEGPIQVVPRKPVPLPTTKATVVDAVRCHVKAVAVRAALALPTSGLLLSPTPRRSPVLEACAAVVRTHPVGVAPAEVVPTRTTKTKVAEDAPRPLPMDGPTVVPVAATVVGPTAMGASAPTLLATMAHARVLSLRPALT